MMKASESSKGQFAIAASNEEWFHPEFNFGDFRRAGARYVKLLIRARCKAERGFRSPQMLRSWKLLNIGEERLEAWQLMNQAADALADLNRNYLPRCGSGGVAPMSAETPFGRLIEALAFLAAEGHLVAEGIPSGGPDHNSTLRCAASMLQRGEQVDWDRIVDWNQLPAIRSDLDQLPEPERDFPKLQLGRIEESLRMLLQERIVQKSYSTADAAQILGKAEFTVREWCRLGRVHAEKRSCGRGTSKEWLITHEELTRIQAEGLLPL